MVSRYGQTLRSQKRVGWSSSAARNTLSYAAATGTPHGMPPPPTETTMPLAPSVVDSQAKARLHTWSKRWALPMPRYETVAHTTYTVHIQLPAPWRERLLQTQAQEPDSSADWASLSSALGLHKKRPTKSTHVKDGAGADGKAGEIMFTGRPAAQKRDAVARSVANLAGLLENWDAKREVRSLKEREAKLAKSVQMTERKEKRKDKKREKRERERREVRDGNNESTERQPA